MVFSKDLIKKVLILIIIFTTFFILHLLTQNTLENFFSTQEDGDSGSEDLNTFAINNGFTSLIASMYVQCAVQSNVTLGQIPLPPRITKDSDLNYIKTICFILNDKVLHDSLKGIVDDEDKQAIDTFTNLLENIDDNFEAARSGGNINKNIWTDSVFKINMDAVMKVNSYIGQLYTKSKSSGIPDTLKRRYYRNILWILSQPELIESHIKVFLPQQLERLKNRCSKFFNPEKNVQSGKENIKNYVSALRTTYDNFRTGKGLNWKELLVINVDDIADPIISSFDLSCSEYVPFVNRIQNSSLAAAEENDNEPFRT